MPMNRKPLAWYHVVPLAALVLLLTACPSTSSVPTSLLVEENAWTFGIPDEAEIVSPEEFGRRVASGELRLITSEMVAEQAAEREAAFDADREALVSAATGSPAVAALLAEADGVDAYEGERIVELPSGDSVSLFGWGTQFRNQVQIEALAQDPANALADYALGHALAPADVRAQLPSPEGLEGAPLADVRAALAQLEALLATSADPAVLGAARLDEAWAVVPAQVIPGNGTDNDGVCAPTNLASRFWFPLRSFLSPMKQQARRGTCWAFTAIGAIESRERVQNDNAVDLSEQFLVNKVKEDWDESEFVEGYWTDRALGAAVDRGQAFPTEAGWTYNPAPNRADPNGSNAAAYAGTCTPYSGTCSPTAHQSLQVCTTFVFEFCSYATVTYGGAGPTASRAIQVWASGQSFDLSRYRMLLAQGHVLMASFPVYKGVMNDVGADGIVRNYARTRLDALGNEIPGSYGGHAVQIVGFLSNADMTTVGGTPTIGGGGYFIIKNSWGCRAGDAGFYYVPADYVSSRFTSLSVLDFDGRRSSRWVAEQNTPGGTVAPTVQIKANPAVVDLRVETNLAQFFAVTHPVARGVTLRVTSDRDGVLYNGPWATDPNALFGPELRRTFTTTGVRTLTLEATYGTGRRSANLFVDVRNTPPTVNLSFSGTAYVGVAFPITALVADVNESDAGGLCSRTTWSVDTPDAVAVASGCVQQVTFGATGSRQVRVRTVDSDGAVGVRTATLDVQPTPANPYPLVTTYGLYARNSLFAGGVFIGCGDVAVAGGATVDFRQDGCTLSVIGDPPKRYSAALVVENPDAEALTYDWRTIVRVGGVDTTINTALGSASATFVPYSPGNAIEVTNDCRITVTVQAPDPARSKPLTVWAGRCTYWSTVLN
jgi:hypothetical protein